jgi:hypothetical protein
LRQWQERLLLLKSHWTNPMVSSQCFDAHIHRARHIAEHLLRSIPLYRPSGNQPAVTIDDQTFDIEDPAADERTFGDPASDDPAVEVHAVDDSAVDASQSLLTDILEDEDIPVGDMDDGTPLQDSSEVISKRDSFPIIWALPVSHFNIRRRYSNG